MPALAREQASDCSNPVLDVYLAIAGMLVDPSSLEFQIYDISDPAKLASPVQVYPLVPGDWAVVNLADCPGGDRLGTGHFVAEYTPEAAEPLGTHRLSWQFKRTPTSGWQTFSEEFEVLSELTPSVVSGMYCSIASIRAEGITVAMADDPRVLSRIQEASKLIDKITGRFFEPRELTITLDGTGSNHLLFNLPIIAIDQIEILGSDGSASGVVDSQDYRVYNRHLTQQLLDPDDRNNPKVSFVSADDVYESTPLQQVGLRWPKGWQNVRVQCVLGYTDPDGSSEGSTPFLISKACRMLAIRELPDLGDTDECCDAKSTYRIKEMRTREQTIKWAEAREGGLTGDPDIDTILAIYRRQPAMGSV